MKKLIINADDFGFSEAFNYGVIHAFEHGILTSASIMPNMDAAVHAAALAKMHPKLCISQHTNIVQGNCCADPAAIPSIVRPDGSFYRSGEYMADGFAKPNSTGTRVADKEDFKRETRAQLERFKQLLGYYPVHIEGHSILSAAIMQGLGEVAKEYGMHMMTFDNAHQEGYMDVWYPFDPEVAKAVGFFENDCLSAEGIIKLLEYFKSTDHEICAIHCHPGYVDATIMDNSTLVLPRCRDLLALCDPRVAEWIKNNGIELIRYDDIKIA